MKKLLLAVFLLSVTLVQAQTKPYYVAAKTGLSIREKPEIGARVLDKIPYGTKVSLLSPEEEKQPVATEGMSGYWEKVRYNNKTGYIVGSYLFPFPPPRLAAVKEMKQYLAQISQPFGNKLILRSGIIRQIEEGGYEMRKQLYRNGAEWHEFLGYEYGSDTYFLPDFSLEQGFLLLRLLPEFKDLFGEKDEFPSENRVFNKEDREYKVTVEKEDLGDRPWLKRIRIEYEDAAFYVFEMFYLDTQLVIFFGGGL